VIDGSRCKDAGGPARDALGGRRRFEGLKSFEDHRDFKALTGEGPTWYPQKAGIDTLFPNSG